MNCQFFPPHFRRDTESPTEFDSNNNLKASFEQLSSDRINDETNKNLAMLKSLETIIQERVQSFAVFLVRYNLSTGVVFVPL